MKPSELVLLCLIGSMLVVALGLTGCAAEMGRNKSDDLANENTTLKVKQADLQLKLDQATSDLKACQSYYKLTPR